MKLVFVSSGSKGNATLIQGGDALIQIDMGITKRALVKGLEILGKSVQDIDGLFLTHEHSDHISGVSTIARHTKVYASEETYPVSPEQVLWPGVGVNVKNMLVMPFSSSHDAVNPVNYVIYADDVKLGYVTDTGTIEEEGLDLLKNCDYYLFESNHDVKMLRESPRPTWLKRRIRSACGHLSNDECANYLSMLIGEKTKQIFLGHISDDCNRPEIAEETLRKKLRKSGIDDSKFKIVAIPQQTLQIGGELL